MRFTPLSFPSLTFPRLAAVSVLVAVFLVQCTCVCSGDAPEMATRLEWVFDQAGGMQGWTVGGHLKDVAVTNEGLSATATDHDPILLSPVFKIPLRPTQIVEIRMKSTVPAQAQLFWATDLEGKYGGFSETKTLSFPTKGDSTVHTVRLRPFWHIGPELVRLRFDPPAAGSFTLLSIRVLEPVGEIMESDRTQWTFAGGLEGWALDDGCGAVTTADGMLAFTTESPQAALTSPLLSLDAADRFYVSFRMAADAGAAGSVFAVAKDKPGKEAVSFRLIPDGKMHTYNVDVGGLDNWKGEILLIGIQPSDEPGAKIAVESIAVTAKPAGPVDLRARYFGGLDAIRRIERPAAVTCLLENNGGTDAENVLLTLKAPEGVEILDANPKTIPAIRMGLPREATWKVATSTPGEYRVSVEIAHGGEIILRETAALDFSKTPDVPKTDYIPEPQPVKSTPEIGVFYFPGWPDMGRWRPILDYPERKPALGWYDEANPECVDWQIKWAVEHGADFFMVDWYWDRGGRHLEHWIHDGYMNAKFREYLKWCVMWANHNRPGSHSMEDWRAVTQYWIDHYFGMDEYYRIDGKPVVVIWSPSNIRRDVGGTEEAARLYAMSQEMAKAAGYKGIYFVAMFSHENKFAYETLKREGYDAATSYHGFQVAQQRTGKRQFDFQEVVETSPELWAREEADSGEMEYFPIVDSGWDSRPWHGGQALVISGRTPQKFGALCRKAKAFAKEHGSRIITIGPCNEWGEGSYIEPYAEYVFGDLDAMREAFCPPGEFPPNLVPEDIGRGPYDLPLPEEKTAWEFDDEADVAAWSCGGIHKGHLDGTFAGESFGGDPIMTSPPIRVSAAQFSRLVLRMRCDGPSTGQLFWATPAAATCENNSIHLQVIGDGEFHDYTLDLAAHPGWRGLITSLRLDPVAGPGRKFDIDSLRLE